MHNSNSGAIRLGAAIAGILTATAASAFDVVSGDWKFSVNGNINVDYIYSSCQSASSAEPIVTVGGACTGTASGSSVSNISNGLLPAAISFGLSTTQNGIDIAADFGLYPGIATNDGGSPNLQQGAPAGNNVGLGTTGLDVRQVYMTFGNKDMGTFTLGRNFGLFGFDAIINDMTLLGVGVAGASSGANPANTTLGSIGFGYIYTDTLAQIDYTTPDFSGFKAEIGIFDPVNSLTDTNNVAKKAPGVHGKLSYTLKMADDMSFYASVTGITQKQNGSYTTAATLITPSTTVPTQYTSNGGDIFAKFAVAGFEFDGSYYYGKGMGTTALFVLSSDGLGDARKSDGYLLQATYKIDAVKFGVKYGVSKLDFANAADAAATPDLLQENSKVTGGVYYSLTKNLTLLAEVSAVKTQAHNGNENKSTDANIGAFLGF